MFRSVVNAIESPLAANSFMQIVRWRRKPRWLPVAKSKIFRVPERKVECPKERAELLRLHANYKTQLRAVRGFLMNDTIAREATSTADHLIISPEQMEEEFRQCCEVNDKWNSEIAVIRNQRLQQERDAHKELILQRLDAKNERLSSRRQSAEELVRLEKIRSKSMITPENIDRAIEEALAETKDFNFAIDLGGRILRNEPAVEEKKV